MQHESEWPHHDRVVTLPLDRFPALIYRAEERVALCDRNLLRLDDEMKAISLSLHAEAGDKSAHPDLTNDTKRAAWVHDQLSDRDDYCDLRIEHASIAEERARSSRYLTLCTNAFRVSRLMYERETAILVLQTEENKHR